MKQIITFLLMIFVVGCATDSSKNDGSATKDSGNSTESLSPQLITPPGGDPIITKTDQPPVTNPNQANVPAGADGKVYHFVCADGCEGGHGDNKAACPVCGKEMSHNQAYHATDAQPNTAPTINPGAQSPIINPAAPQTPEPAQNALGVWHYTCPSGCVGGGGAAGPCAICGTTLAHNAGYH